MRTEINAQALANTARECIKMSSKKTIAAVIAHWNLCVEQAGFTGSYDFPTDGYTRKAQLIADLEGCASQLEAFNEKEHYAQIEAQRISDVDQAHDAALLAEYGLDAIKYISVYPNAVVSHEEAHAEALEMDAERDHEIALRMNAAHDSSWQELATPGAFEELPTQRMKIKAVNAAHAEALEENDMFDGIIRDDMTPEQRTIHVRRQGMDIYGDRFKKMLDSDHAEALRINDAIDTAGLVIRAMKGMDIEGIMSGIRAGMYNSGLDDLVNLSQTALRVEVARAHGEALANIERWDDFYSAYDDEGREQIVSIDHAEALAYNLQFDFYALSWDVQALAIENAEDEAATIEYCATALEEGAGGLTGYVIEVKPGEYLDLASGHPTKNPLHATYFEPHEKREGKLKQFCMNGEKVVRLGDAVVDVAFDTQDYRSE